MKIVAFPFTEVLKTPLGDLVIKATARHIHEIYFSSENEEINPNPNNITSLGAQQLSAYFNGTLEVFDLPLMQEGTPFQQQVWQTLNHISYGTTLSYQKLALALGDEKLIRAVAGANGKNKLAIVVPCHRVIATDGKLTGYAWGLKRKRWLIDFEARISGRSLLLF